MPSQRAKYNVGHPLSPLTSRLLCLWPAPTQYMQKLRINPVHITTTVLCMNYHLSNLLNNIIIDYHRKSKHEF